jgi:Putative addiction module component
MSTSLEALQAEVSRLSPADRSRLLEHLIASLEVDDEVEAAWDAVADEREAAVDAGTVRPVMFEDAIARLEARFPRCKSPSCPPQRRN